MILSSSTMMDCKDSDDNMKEVIPPIHLPKNVLPEDLAKMVFNVLYRKALHASDKWSHWVLLATLHILETNTAPVLDIKSLCKLQGLCKSNANYFESKKLKDEVVEKKSDYFISSELESQCPGQVSKNDVDLDIAAASESHSKKRKHSGETDKVRKLKKTEDKPGTNCKETGGNKIEFTKDYNSEIVKKFHGTGTLFSSKESQVTPKMLSLMHNKWTQMWKKKLHNRGSQTEDEIDSKSYSSVHTQTQELSEDKTDVGNKTYIHQEVQTVIRQYQHFSSQYSYNPKLVKKPTVPWKLIRISGLPVKKTKKKSCSSDQPNQRNDENGTEYKVETENDGMPDNKSDVETSESSLVDIKLRKSLFHGRLMITSKSKITPPNIPLLPVDSFLLNDPRVFESD
ncbi:uncharacterized protein LOC135226456 [Macrobrachium nipponense]|uniref:uncharacterized protein LOC135226456 n=1 Tax=Macrobrachium nipponense TaxID=159736 RepID=UPI0030C83D05